MKRRTKCAWMSNLKGETPKLILTSSRGVLRPTVGYLYAQEGTTNQQQIIPSKDPLQRSANTNSPSTFSPWKTWPSIMPFLV